MARLKRSVNFFIFLLISILIAGCLNNNSQDSQHPEDDEPETIIKPEDVNLSVDRVKNVRTKFEHWYEIIGEPTGSNITWFVDNEIIGYENRKLENEDFNDDTKDAGEIGIGHCVTVL